MKEITLTINDREVKGKGGNTVLEVCQANGIDLPTLCHLEGLSDVGACRMCVVEIEGERRPVPSCTYTAKEGLVVRTNTKKLEDTLYPDVHYEPAPVISKSEMRSLSIKQAEAEECYHQDRGNNIEQYQRRKLIPVFKLYMVAYRPVSHYQPINEPDK